MLLGVVLSPRRRDRNGRYQASQCRPCGRDLPGLGLCDGASQVTNLGHTVEIGFGTGLEAEFDGKVYTFKQLHFHTPSEHRVDGITYPMEMHLVHTRRGASPDGIPDYLVIGVFLRMGNPNRFIAEFLNAIPEEEGQSTSVEGVYFEDALPPDFDLDRIRYYHYRGSLTTPPYTESVEWLVLKEVFEASPEQIQRINELEGDNARRVQALYNRVVEE
jgi:carbonic anhydrase